MHAPFPRPPHPPTHTCTQELDDKKAKEQELADAVKWTTLASTRQAKAFAEIQRLIEWAVTPPSSVHPSQPK